jgi:hypothetical protein
MIARRTVLVASAAVIASSAAAETKQGNFDLANPRDQLLAYAKMRARLDGGHAIWHHAIDMFALVEGRVSEFLFRREGVGVHKIRVEDNGDLTAHYLASTYPVEGGNVTNGVWTNHITGKQVNLRGLPGAKGPVVRVTTQGAKNAERDLTAPSAERYVIGAPVIFGPRISISDDMLVYRSEEDQRRIFSRAASAGDYTATELGAYEADLADVMDAKLAGAPASRSMVGVVPWAPDFGMDGLKGTLMIRHRARKVASPDELPASLREKAEKDTPGIFTAPKLAV